jgi:branched-chain amino acid transport system permease protein
VYGALLVLMMLYRPEGLWPDVARKRELHAGEEANVAAESSLAADRTAEPEEASIELGRPVA